jgi:hypothetical protein
MSPCLKTAELQLDHSGGDWFWRVRVAKSLSGGPQCVIDMLPSLESFGLILGTKWMCGLAEWMPTMCGHVGTVPEPGDTLRRNCVTSLDVCTGDVR